MGEDKSTAVPVAAPPLRPLGLTVKLAPTPRGRPRYAVTIRDPGGAEVVLADPRATRALVALMNMHAVIGGAACHWGGPSAYAEVMAAIHGILFSVTGREWHEAYNLVNDPGHAENGLYALRANYGFDGLTLESLKGFRSLSSKLTGHGESHLNPQGVLLSNGPLGSALPQAQGLAIADRLAGRDRVTLAVVSDGAAMEGEAREAFAAIPGLAAKGRLAPFVMVVSDNDTKLSGRISGDAFSMQPSLAALGALGWQVERIENGHDLAAVYAALVSAIARARAHPEQPVCLWVKTVKGYGVKATEQSASGGHGFPLSSAEAIVPFVAEVYGGNPPEDLAAWARSLRADWEARQAARAAQPAATASAAVKKDKDQSGIGRGVIRAAQAGYPVFSVSADVQGSTGLSSFQKTFPERWIEVGVAEANMVSVAAGLSKAGYIPVVDAFAQFGVTKGNLPLTMAALSQAPVIAVFSHVGLQDAADGASHQATTYLAAVGSIPHTVVVACSCAEEAEAFMFQAIERQAAARVAGADGESVVFFLGREAYPVRWAAEATYVWGKAQVLAEGRDVALIGCGALVGKTLEAARLLAEGGVGATVINLPFINRVDVATVGAAVSGCGGRVVTIEDHQVIGGMGAQVAHALACAGIPHRMRSLGIDGEFGRSAYVAEELYVRYGLTTAALVSAAQSLLK